MDYTDVSASDVDTAYDTIRGDMRRSVLLGLLGMAIAAGGIAFDYYNGVTATASEVRSSSPA